jgi:hypothetical protein
MVLDCRKRQLALEPQLLRAGGIITSASRLGVGLFAAFVAGCFRWGAYAPR